MSGKIIRVFPRRTNATPDDSLAFVGLPPDGRLRGVAEVHISVTFTWDLPKADSLRKAWSRIAPVKVGGPATGMRGEEFVPGKYLKQGMAITSRGCPNRCWFCSVPEREGSKVRELPIRDGWSVEDDNLLACSKEHILAVGEMLKKQRKRKRRITFTGGLEPGRIEQWTVQWLKKEVKPQSFFMAYDSPDDYESLSQAADIIFSNGYQKGSSAVCSYVLMGYPNDTLAEAKKRLVGCCKLGIRPFAMLWRDHHGQVDVTWRELQTEWVVPAIVGAKIKKILGRQKVYSTALGQRPQDRLKS